MQEQTWRHLGARPFDMEAVNDTRETTVDPGVACTGGCPQVAPLCSTLSVPRTAIADAKSRVGVYCGVELVNRRVCAGSRV